MSRRAGAFAVGCLFAVAHASAQEKPPNVAVVILDDIGVELIGAYTSYRRGAVQGRRPVEHSVTSNIDALAHRGLLFRNAWSTPLCGQTRFAMFTGQHGFRTGRIGGFHDEAGPFPETLPQRLADRYPERVAIGKWHLSSYTPYHELDASPTALGFTRYAGAPENTSYRGYAWATDPPPPRRSQALPPEYLTEREVQEAIAFVESPHVGPWLLWLGLHAAHRPWSEEETPFDSSSPCRVIDDEPRRVRCRQIEILDDWLGALFQAFEAADPGLQHTTILLVGDNGSPLRGEGRPEAIPGQVSRGTKTSVYEGGINVPLIVAGAGVAPNSTDSIQETAALVHVVDVFATVLDLAAVSGPESRNDSVSFASVLAGWQAARRCVYADGVRSSVTHLSEHPKNHDVAIRNQRYKLIRRAQMFGSHDFELYDLLLDPGETNALPDVTPVFETLNEELTALDAEPWRSPCKAGDPFACGLGAELAPVAVALYWLRLRRRARSSLFERAPRSG
jgi:arylsulfatase A-like enzyme